MLNIVQLVYCDCLDVCLQSISFYIQFEFRFSYACTRGAGETCAVCDLCHYKYKVWPLNKYMPLSNMPLFPNKARKKYWKRKTLKHSCAFILKLNLQTGMFPVMQCALKMQFSVRKKYNLHQKTGKLDEMAQLLTTSRQCQRVCRNGVGKYLLPLLYHLLVCSHLGQAVFAQDCQRVHPVHHRVLCLHAKK